MTADLEPPRAPWRGPRSPHAWTCPRCRTAAVPDPAHPGALKIVHKAGCRNPTGIEVAHSTATGETSP